jgi:HK97 family phage prohead protease
MALEISKKAITQANNLINDGKINEEGDWSFSADDGNTLFSSVGEDWSKYALWFLVQDTDADEETKERYKYPYGKNGKIWRNAVIAIKQRAAQQDFTELVTTADNLLEAIDKKLGKDEKEDSASEKERRYFPVSEIRLTTDEEGRMYIEGYPIVYEKYADLWGFREIIRKGAAKKALEKSDEYVLWNHEADQPMAAKRNGTLEATEDDNGVFIKAEVSKTFWGRNAYEAIQNGVVDKMSFAFSVAKDEFTFTEGMDTREILEFDELYDYSPVTYPAYKDTSVIARSKDLALRNKPEPGSPGDGGGSPSDVLKEARENIRRIRDNLTLEGE